MAAGDRYSDLKLSKKKKEIVNQIKNEYIVYIIIMFVCILIRCIPMSSGNSNIDNTINDIVIGGFSSTFVAMLIAWHNNKKDEQKKQKIMYRFTEALFTEIFAYYSDMDLTFFGSCFDTFENCKSVGSLSQRNEVSWAQHVLPDTYLKLVGYQDRIAKNADRVLDIEFELISEEILSEEDIDSIRKLRECIGNLDEKDEEYYEQTIRWPKLVFRHDRITRLFMYDVRFKNRLNELFSQYPYFNYTNKYYYRVIKKGKGL